MYIVPSRVVIRFSERALAPESPVSERQLIDIKCRMTDFSIFFVEHLLEALGSRAADFRLPIVD